MPAGDRRRRRSGYAVQRGVATLTMDQPHNRNALTPALLGGLADGLEAALADPAVRVIVLTHTGPAFCAGADLSGAAGAGRRKRRGARPAGWPTSSPPSWTRPSQCWPASPGTASAAVSGWRRPATCRSPATTAKFGFTEVRIGVAPAIISVVCLPKLRRADALELFLTASGSAPRGPPRPA